MHERASDSEAACLHVHSVAEKNAVMASANCEPIMRVMTLSRSRDKTPGQKVGRLWPEAESYPALRRPKKGQNLPLLYILQTVQKRQNLIKMEWIRKPLRSCFPIFKVNGTLADRTGSCDVDQCSMVDMGLSRTVSKM